MNKMIQKFDEAIENIVFICTVGFVVICFLQVIFRYVFNNSLYWSEELCRYLFVWTVFLGSGIGIIRKKHIGVDLFERILPSSIKKYVLTIFNLLVAIYLIFLAFVGFNLAFKNMGQLSPAMQMPLGIVYIAVPAGAFVMLINTIRIAVFNFNNDEEKILEVDEDC